MFSFFGRPLSFSLFFLKQYSVLRQRQKPSSEISQLNMLKNVLEAGIFQNGGLLITSSSQQNPNARISEGCPLTEKPLDIGKLGGERGPADRRQ